VREHLITVEGHTALVMEMGRHMDVREWVMRPRAGVQGLEAFDANGQLVRLELQEPEVSEECGGYDAE
jgi:hypothetical protein